MAGKIKAEDGSHMSVSDFMFCAKEEEPEPTVEQSIAGVMEVIGVKKHG